MSDVDDTDRDEDREGCVLGAACVCPHPFHTSDECCSAEMAEKP